MGVELKKSKNGHVQWEKSYLADHEWTWSDVEQQRPPVWLMDLCRLTCISRKNQPPEGRVRCRSLQKKPCGHHTAVTWTWTGLRGPRKSRTIRGGSIAAATPHRPVRGVRGGRPRRTCGTRGSRGQPPRPACDCEEGGTLEAQRRHGEEA